jgi:hypothetical protein
MGKRVSLVALLLACFGIASGETVSGIVVDGSLDDWGVSAPTGTNGNNWVPTQGAWASEDSVGSDGYVGPGYGGQDFDIEAVYSGFDTSTNTLYFALVTGFDIGGESLGGTLYLPGDVFFDFGNDGSWDLAFDMSSRTGTSPGSTMNAIATPGLTYTDTPFGVPGFASGPFTATGGSTESNAVSFAYDNNGPAAWNQSLDHNVYEFSYVVTNASWLAELYQPGNGYLVHWTMACGNDLLQLPVDPAPAPLPGAALLGLVGATIVGAKRVVTRRRQNQPEVI